MGLKQLDTGGYIGNRCDLECPAHGKAECVYTSAGRVERTAKSRLHPAKKKKKAVENCGINTLRAAVSAELFPAVNMSRSLNEAEAFLCVRVRYSRTVARNRMG